LISESVVAPVSPGTVVFSLIWQLPPKSGLHQSALLQTGNLRHGSCFSSMRRKAYVLRLLKIGPARLPWSRRLLPDLVETEPCWANWRCHPGWSEAKGRDPVNSCLIAFFSRRRRGILGPGLAAYAANRDDKSGQLARATTWRRLVLYRCSNGMLSIAYSN